MDCSKLFERTQHQSLIYDNYVSMTEEFWERPRLSKIWFDYAQLDDDADAANVTKALTEFRVDVLSSSIEFEMGWSYCLSDICPKAFSTDVSNLDRVYLTRIEPLCSVLYLLGEETSRLADAVSDLDEDACELLGNCLLYTSPSPRDRTRSRMPSSA